MAGKPNCLVFPVSRLWSHVSARLVSYVLSLCSAPREWDTISSERSRAEALFFFASFFFFSIRSLAKSGDMIYGKMVSKGSSPGNHGGGLRIFSREHEVRLKDCAPVAATVLSGPNITW